MSKYFSKPTSLGASVKVELDLSNYATKEDFKNAAGVDISSFVKKNDLADLKSVVDKLDIDKLKNVPSSLSNLKSKVNNANIKNIEDKIPNITNLAKTAALTTAEIK